jgi:hypothetical protein
MRDRRRLDQPEPAAWGSGAIVFEEIRKAQRFPRVGSKPRKLLTFIVERSTTISRSTAAKRGECSPKKWKGRP